ncbi:MAG: class I SAM-dependent methyltransferase family protein [Candidatus Thermoplasmatota archaeon]|jgi:tRNA (guanine37-N1)-methyltransferase|nr:class I SAM-dependent methyltransferase family protein [Candidatus Thermoplasmatota archaeon]
MDSEKNIALSVPLKDAEKIRKHLREKKLLRNDLEIQRDKKFVYLPITKKTEELTTYLTTEKQFKKKVLKPKSYKELLQVDKKTKQKLPNSYDIIGDIALIKLPKNITTKPEEIGQAILKSNKNIKTVCRVEPVTGEYRVRKIDVIAGEKNTKTTHKEYGLTFNVDIKNTYFSPRLATERKRIADQVKQGETVVDMFAGVGPFSIMIAKYARPEIIYAFDKNKKAVELAKQNIKKNKVLDKIEIIHADAKKIDKILNIKADRIIMNLPFSAHKFFTNALKIANNICIIHYYDVLKEDKIQERINTLKKIAERNKSILTKTEVRKIKTYAPREFYIGIDITAKKNLPT